MTDANPQQPLPASEQAVQSTAPHRPPDDVEETYYEGSPMLRGELGKGLLWIVIGLVLIAALVAVSVLQHRVHVPWWASLIVIVIALALMLIPVLQTKSIRYRITNYRIDYERGIFSKNIDTLELWHVEDIRFHQSLIDRIMGVGNISVISHDDTMPDLLMTSLPNPRSLFEQLKQRVIAVKRQRGVIKMDSG
jgi:membrane protein YdbS with pleckstrin-like domain